MYALVSPYGSVKRRSWSTPERTVVKEVFKTNFANRTLPSLSDCQEIINSSPELLNRTPAQLKSWISNNIKEKTNAQIAKTPGW